jgi:paraquat-inducible protein A
VAAGTLPAKKGILSKANRSVTHAHCHRPNDYPQVLTICPQCDLAQNLPALAPGARSQCARCLADLRSGVSARLDLALAALATALILLVIMNVFPLIGMRVQGVERQTTLIGAVVELQERGMNVLAVLVLATTVLGPLLEILLLCAVLLPIRVDRLERASAQRIGLIQRIRPWSMVEVFLLGVLVSVVKLAALAQIVPGPAIWACGALIVDISLLHSLVRTQDLWAWSRIGLRSASASSSIALAGPTHSARGLP